MDKTQKLEAISIEKRNAIVERAEIALLRQIERGNVVAILFALKTQGRHRGWEQTELDEVKKVLNIIVRGSGLSQAVVDKTETLLQVDCETSSEVDGSL